MGMMFRRNKLRRLEKEKQAEQKESVKDVVPEPKRRARKPKFS